MGALDRIIELYARQAELQAHSGVGEYLSDDERAELAYIPTLLAKAWERRRCEMAKTDAIDISPPPRKNKWHAQRGPSLPVYHEPAAERAA